MEKLTRYLKDVWNVTDKLYKHKKGDILKVVLGNVSGDMDSVICSIALGYYLTHQQGFYEEEKEEVDPESLTKEKLSKFYIPVLNMQKEDLEARSDIIYHLDKVGINKDELVSADMIDLAHYAKEDKIGVNLVDHNLPDCTQEYLTEHIERIVDHHHEKEAELPDLVYKDNQVCGSAASLVSKLILNDESMRDQLVDKNVAWVLSAPILIDTVNFKESLKGKKWKDIDHEVYNKIKEIGGDQIPSDYFDTLYHLKTDKKNNVELGWHLLQRKDYKNYKINDWILGISTVFLSLGDANENFGTDKMHEEFDKIMEERNLKGYLVMTHYEEDNDVKRQVLSYSKDDELAKKFETMFDNMEGVNLEKISIGKLTDIENCFCWQNHSTSVSRKKFEPKIREYFE